MTQIMQNPKYKVKLFLLFF